MKSSMLSSLVVAVSTASLALVATTCDTSSALPFPTTASDCNGDAACLALFTEGQENALCLIDDTCLESCDPDTDPTCLKKKRDARVSRRADFSCDGSEVCYVYLDVLMCLDFSTGIYDDEYGGIGNIYTGEYLGADGSFQTVSAGSSATGVELPTNTGSSEVTTTADSGSQTAAQTGSANKLGMSFGPAEGALLGLFGISYLL